MVKSTNERTCLSNIKTKFSNQSIMKVYAQSGEQDDIGKDRFYQIMERTYGSISNTDIKMEAGDLNAKLGRRGTQKGVMEKYALHFETNNNGQRVTESAISKA
jgi:hypothetical protein